jgi:hypothetical protein
MEDILYRYVNRIRHYIYHNNRRQLKISGLDHSRSIFVSQATQTTDTYTHRDTETQTLNTEHWTLNTEHWTDVLPLWLRVRCNRHHARARHPLKRGAKNALIHNLKHLCNKKRCALRKKGRLPHQRHKAKLGEDNPRMMRMTARLRLSATGPWPIPSEQY